MSEARSGGEPILIEMYQVLPGAPLATPAGEGMVRSLPSKALRHCPPLIEATTLGWHVYPPMDFSLRFDGQQTDWLDADGNVHRVPPGAEATVEGWAEHYRKAFPVAVHDGLADDGPSLYNADPNAPNRVEMYSGIVVRTAPGWSLLVRSPANMPRRTDYVLFEGLIETSWWVALLPTIIELTTPGAEVVFQRHRPLAHIQLVHQDSAARDRWVSGSLADVPDEMWEAYRDTRVRRTQQDQPGSYHRRARALRRERSEPELGDDPG